MSRVTGHFRKGCLFLNVPILWGTVLSCFSPWKHPFGSRLPWGLSSYWDQPLLFPRITLWIESKHRLRGSTQHRMETQEIEATMTRKTKKGRGRERKWRDLSIAHYVHKLMHAKCWEQYLLHAKHLIYIRYYDYCSHLNFSGQFIPLTL